jgi:hypothetical protein
MLRYPVTLKRDTNGPILVDRLLDLMHNSRLDQLEAAFRALGKQLSIEIREAA